MKIKLDLRLSLHENAEHYYTVAKKAKRKISHLRDLISNGINIKKNNRTDSNKKKKKWYENYKWFIMPNKGFIVISGRNSNQNEQIYRRILKDNDLFIHADIVGAPFTVIKNGLNCDDETKFAAAQFAISHSRAWKFGNTIGDAYIVKRNQLTKSASGQYVKKGAILITGEREWIRNIKLGLSIGLYDGQLVCFPEVLHIYLKNPTIIHPDQNGIDKNELANKLSKMYKIDQEYILKLLPPGRSKIVNKN